MIIISPLLDSYIRFRLKDPKYRTKVYALALKKELRSTKMGHIILRNLGETMANNTAYHSEFAGMRPNGDYQQMFWESDLGYLWFNGNLAVKNEYFEFAKKEIAQYGHESVLDVGCGWGQFCAEIAASGKLKSVKGIDISETIIAQAKQNFPGTSAVFAHQDIMDEDKRYDLITLFGSTDYISPAIFPNVLKKIVEHACKEIIIVNSLRNVSFEKAMQLTDSVEVKRYDTGYVHPLNHLLKLEQAERNLKFELVRSGRDSIMAIIHK